MKRPPLDALRDWVDRQRWYSARRPAGDEVALRQIADTVIEDGLDVAWWILHVDEAEYLLPLACCRGAAPVHEAIRGEPLSWFDALAHPATAAAALRMLGEGAHGFRAVWLAERPLDLTGLDTSALEQSNTTVRTDEHVLKVFRRLRGGRNPEIEVGEALRQAGSTHVAQLRGWAELATEAATYDVLAVHERIPAPDGFALAVADADRAARDEPEQHFPGAAYELGIALGAVHTELADAFGVQQPPNYASETSRRLLARLAALRDVPELDPYRSAAEAVFADLASTSGPAPVHRIHGDLHLGQTLFADDGWRLIDFEGEPRRPLTERAAPDSPLRDVAGLLRSFDYASRWSSSGGLSGARDSWRQRATAMLLEGYQLQRPDAIDARLLNALVLDKALYEVGYESAHRPQRLRIPLAAVAAICPHA